MNEHLQFEEDFDLYALGALDGEERTSVESHLEDCALCRQRLAAAEQRIGLLGLAAPALPPPPRVKSALFNRVREESRRTQPPPIAPKRSWLSVWRQPVLAWSCAAATAVVAIVFAGRAYTMQHRLDLLQAEAELQKAESAHDRTVADLLTSTETKSVVLRQAADATKPEALVYFQPKRGLLFYAANLPAPQSDRVYQLWLVPVDGAPISAGVFEPNSTGHASIILPPLPRGVAAKAFAVTLEPAGGVPQPTGPKVLIGVL